jgi:23S rRNA pseudouridine2457 synthase
MLIAFNKPFGVLSQFTDDAGRPTLANFIDVPGVYPAGRLDADSEGLLLLTDDGNLQKAIADPAAKLVKRYWAQVEGIPTQSRLDHFATGLSIGEGADRYTTEPASAHAIEPPVLPERDPPIRYRANIPTSWIEVGLNEGKNRQVRRMTAAIGHPTLRLMRVGIGPIDIFELGIAPGVSISIEPDRLSFASKKQKLRTASGGTRGRSLSTGFRSRRYWE